MKKLIIGGCSITHGAETVNGFMHPDNIKNSYSQHIARHLGVDLINVALSGGSNDDIFHSLVEQIDVTDSEHIHSVIAAWTSVSRLHWVNKGRHWFFIPGWASSMDNLYQWQFHRHPSKTTFISGDSEAVLDTLHDQHRFFVENYLDDYQYLNKKLSNYKSALQSHCDNKNIRLVNINIFDLWAKNSHPSALEHMELAQQIQLKFYS
jgi:hypothetical protein